MLGAVAQARLSCLSPCGCATAQYGLENKTPAEHNTRGRTA
jgi:hypothetical protein